MNNNFNFINNSFEYNAFYAQLSSQPDFVYLNNLCRSFRNIGLKKESLTSLYYLHKAINDKYFYSISTQIDDVLSLIGEFYVGRVMHLKNSIEDNLSLLNFFRNNSGAIDLFIVSVDSNLFSEKYLQEAFDFVNFVSSSDKQIDSIRYICEQIYPGFNFDFSAIKLIKVKND